ncbi:sodium-translocating pyrophosphatase [Candidatus Woesearchaeota archaeon]|jgi:K(+)-stimulated pyrophosphate-energized sodium pump|nr:sodium-translocating pyrophosphatase [Candidatus Woesearchaeota archaeon]MBT7237548.1 sodium-translocating pyrophosphatase [Candidatus Woesearchaeota archaeon]
MIISIAFVVSILFLVVFNFWISKKSSGSKAMKDFSLKIREGSKAFLREEYKILFVLILVLTLVILYFSSAFAITFFSGAFFSLIAGRVGMNAATKANVFTTEACKKSVNSGLKIAYLSGLKASIFAMVLGLFAIIVLQSVFGDPKILYGFAFGASLVALFMRVGGGIFTKSADLSADLTGKIEKGLPEDSPKNPAVIADLVGDNVGDVAGMSSDLFESYVASIIATMVMLFALGLDLNVPLILVSIGIISCLVSILVVQHKNSNVAILGSLLVSGVFILGLSYLLLFSYILPILYGLVGGILIGFSVFYFTSSKFSPTRNIAKAAESGAALNVLAGLSNGLLSTVIPIIVISLVMVLSYSSLELLGIAISAVSMLSIMGVVLASTIFGSITDNASGIAELSKKSKVNCSKLDSLGNTTAAIGKGFTISSAALTVLTLLASFILIAEVDVIDLLNVKNMAALFVGGFIPFFFSSLVISAVGKTSSKIVTNVRSQFRSKKLDYLTPVRIATKSSIYYMMISVSFVVVLVVLVGLLLGVSVLGSLIAGAVVSSFLLSIFMANAGGSLDNAKKLVEVDRYGTKVHKNSVVGDGVGDPLKDCSGPALNILIKLIAIISLLFVIFG